MSLGFQIPRNAMVWVLAAMFASVIPHTLRLPLWVTVVCLLCGVWRIMVYRARWHLPGAWIKAVLVFSGGGAVWAHYGSLMGPEAGSALLTLGFCFKLLETHHRRDLFIVIVLGYFVVATSFFFDQQIIDTLYLLLVCFLVTAALLGLHQSPLQTAPKRTARLAFRLLLQSLPLMVLLFALVPRIGPIWALDLSSQGARTGLADEMTPGDIARLSQSPELAFRAEFDGETPSSEQLYWRALVLDQFDGRTWRRHQDQRLPEWVAWHGEADPWSSNGNRLGRQVDYRVIMEPTDKPWLFGLDLARPQQRGVGLTRDFRLVSRNPVAQTFSYRVTSSLDYRLDQDLPRWLIQRNLQLPQRGNERSRSLALQLREASGTPDELVRRVMNLFTEQPFGYTLTPPVLGANSVDQFLFQTRLGFCSHYASAMTFLLRSAGVPSRIVTGYQGGEYNQLGEYVLVHQFDAHAWVEVWLAGRGWVRMDPTAMVSPERIEFGVEQALANEQSFLAGSPFSPLRYRHLAWVSELRLAWDYVNFAWHRSVVGYDADSQRRWLSDLFGAFNWKVLAMALIAGVGVVLGGLSIWVLWRQRSPASSPMLGEYRKLCGQMARQGVPPLPGESPGDYLSRLAQSDPKSASSLRSMAALLERDLYRPPQPETGYRQFRRLRQQLRLRVN